MLKWHTTEKKDFMVDIKFAFSSFFLLKFWQKIEAQKETVDLHYKTLTMVINYPVL